LKEFAVAETFSLEAQPRTLTGKKVSQLRTQGLVPAIIYGSRIQPVTIQIPYRSLELMLMKAGGTRLIEISVGGGTHAVLARAVQRDVIRREITHVDFLAVDLTQTIRTQVPIHFVGSSPAEDSRIGSLSHGVNSLEIEALPADLISAVEVDLSGLKAIGDAIHVRDLNVGSKVTILADADEMIVRVSPPQQVTEETTGEEATTSAEPELIRKERESDEEE
jgi:large subunit ribosomal protein L25